MLQFAIDTRKLKMREIVSVVEIRLSKRRERERGNMTVDR